jgi:hypothetical protein
LTKYCFCFSKSAKKAMNWDFQFTRWRKILLEKCLFIAISLYCFIFLSQYCSSKSLVWRGPKNELILQKWFSYLNFYAGGLYSRFVSFGSRSPEAMNWPGFNFINSFAQSLNAPVVILRLNIWCLVVTVEFGTF